MGGMMILKTPREIQKDVENVLKKYNVIKTKLEYYNMKYNEISELPAINAGIKSGKTYKFNSITENIALEDIEMKDKSLILVFIILTIDSILSSLSNIEKNILTMRYIEKHKWRYISKKNNYSIRNCQRIASYAIEKIANEYSNEIEEIVAFLSHFLRTL
ncbi:hypothetical protein Q2T46_11665 [Thermoanaerobacterium sp. CMT5567-10]|jgi:DNA-directed RNA polymerase specialized sigma subunit|uniref:hypothetical protein n=1 Tax=Thermoanaerobacterium sp. CMT5567-10 TaxID=3061989 RepID=UPI00287F8563|nr:hypothetical protein [Thermoanaerobacterium sp. CMT5567-10]WKV08184.2 hypothetical protein Q2T46_11665 [Thermoanaerobacterium sp. CMT5567-10]